MARLKGHKAGCRCVGCNPAARARGMRKLRALRKAGKLRRRRAPSSRASKRNPSNKPLTQAAVNQLLAKARDLIRTARRHANVILTTPDGATAMQRVDELEQYADTMLGKNAGPDEGRILFHHLSDTVGHPAMHRASERSPALERSRDLAFRTMMRLGMAYKVNPDGSSKSERDRAAERTLEAVDAAARLEHRYTLFGGELVDALVDAHYYADSGAVAPPDARLAWKRLIQKVRGF